MDSRFIRNFSIVAHIDHGKSTLADQLLLKTGAITEREFQEQILDDLDDRAGAGHHRQGPQPSPSTTSTRAKTYELNLIDTPGHVDFHYEVSRSLAACEGALLLVDAFQGVQAQTVANAYAAIDANLTIIPVINKIDLPVTRVDEVLEEIETVLGLDAVRCAQGQRQAGDRHRRRVRRDHRTHSASRGQARRAAAGAGLRQQVRQLPRRDDLRPRRRRHDSQGTEDPVHEGGDRPRSARSRPVPPAT